MKYWAKKITREKDYSFSITKSHAKLIHHFLIKYLTKGYASLPVHEQDENPSDTDEEYEQRVKEHYRNKCHDYEEIMGEDITAANREVYCPCREQNKLNGSTTK